MVKRKYTEKYTILDPFMVGFEFEFYSKFKPTELQKLLTKSLKGKEIKLEWDITRKGNKITKKLKSNASDDSKVSLSDKVFKLEMDFSGGDEMYELVTGPMDYHESLIILKKIFDFIGYYGSTTELCGLHINVSLEKHKELNIQHLNLLKFAMDFDEEKIWKYFPNRKNNVYASSIKQYFFTTPYLSFKADIPLTAKLIAPPYDKYFGVNFTKIPNNYMEFRYLGGEDYEQKYKEVSELIEDFAFSMYDTLKEPLITKKQEKILKKMIDDNKFLLSSINRIENFKNVYPNLILSVDLKSDLMVLKTYLSQISIIIWNLIANCKVTEGHINYDTDTSKFQIKDADIKNAVNLNSLELIDCKFQGTGKNIRFWNCEINESILENVHFVQNNTCKTMKIMDSIYEQDNEFEDCYILNKNDYEITGTFKNCVIRKGTLSDSAEVDDKCIVAEDIIG